MSIPPAVIRRQDMEAIIPNSSVEPGIRAANAKTWTARVLGGLAVLFLIVDGAGKVMRLAPYVEGTAKVGYPEGCLVPLGIVLLASTILYVIPRTAFLGAILLTGYLGGATATHVRLGQPFFFPVVFGVILWGCLYLRDERLRSLLPFSS
jgi:hypothetical protein